MERRDRELPLPSEDSGDLAHDPTEGVTDDHMVATEEGMPWTPPMDRVMSRPRDDNAGVQAAGVSDTDAGELEREDAIQPEDLQPARDGELQADVIEALRGSDVTAGDHLRVAVTGSRVTIEGEVESFEVLNEVLGIVGDVPGVTEVVDEIEVEGV